MITAPPDFTLLYLPGLWLINVNEVMDVRLPKLGEGAESGTVVGIMVKEGDTITKGQTLLELENEKAVAPIPSPVSGKVTSIRIKEGDKLTVGQLILKAEEEGRGVPAPGGAQADAQAKQGLTAREPDQPKEPSAEQGSEAPDESMEPISGEPPAAAPSIRKVARELGIDLRRIRGSERGGRIVMADVRAYIQRLQKLAFEAKPGAAPKAHSPAAERVDFAKWGPVTRKRISSIRSVISQRMLESWTTIPHVTQFDEADITTLNELRKRYAPIYQEKGARLTLTSFVLKAVVATLKKHPMFNTSFDEVAGEIVQKEYYHLGLAVDTEQGLIVPVLRDVDKKDLLQLSKEISEFSEKARNRKVSLEELKGGTFTISNQGGIGGAHFTPIINKPEVAILGLGRGLLKPVIREDKIEPRLLLPLALSYDHRLIDGAQAARFMVELVEALEKFSEGEVKL